jgi:hypothetical protein
MRLNSPGNLMLDYTNDKMSVRDAGDNQLSLLGVCKGGGTFVCNGASGVTVADVNVAITDIVLVSLNTVGGTVGAIPAVKTITAGVGFTIAGTASDTSTYNYRLLKNTL